jgi:hypothetical protein
MAYESPDIPVSDDALYASPSVLEASTSSVSEIPENSPISQIYAAFGPSIAPTMIRISECESTDAQFNPDGSTVHSKTDDWGWFQINESWDATAKELGLDYKHSLTDNIRMAKIVYDRQGISAWTCARVLGII